MMFGIMPSIASIGTKHDHQDVRTEELRHLPQGAQVARPLRRGPRIHRLPRRKTRSGNPGRMGPAGRRLRVADQQVVRSEEHTSELQSLMRKSYAVFCVTKKKRP